ncbi:unnamed protein product [Ostreobium quekettii]|uniref:Uncharacterized protein n=1 Tax=Ostreobium quekettii TaxID=121088 RepID=A0A8S1IW02_9CHLO|nr:unnamed protein product [Ostreobium quekettii]
MASVGPPNSGVVNPRHRFLARRHPWVAAGGRSGRNWRGRKAGGRCCGPSRAVGSGHAHPFDSEPLIKRFPSVEGLPLSLYTPYDGLPMDGEVGGHPGLLIGRNGTSKGEGCFQRPWTLCWCAQRGASLPSSPETCLQGIAVVVPVDHVS